MLHGCAAPAAAAMWARLCGRGRGVPAQPGGAPAPGRRAGAWRLGTADRLAVPPPFQAHSNPLLALCTPLPLPRHHHKYPMDFDRLVFPPPIAALVIGLFHLLLHALLPLVSVAEAGAGRGRRCCDGRAAAAAGRLRARCLRAQCLPMDAAAAAAAQPAPCCAPHRPPPHPSPCSPGPARCWAAAWPGTCCTTPRTGRCTRAAPTGCSRAR